MNIVCLVVNHIFGSWSEKINAQGLTAETHGLPFIQIRKCIRCGQTYYRPVK